MFIFIYFNLTSYGLGSMPLVSINANIQGKTKLLSLIAGRRETK